MQEIQVRFLSQEGLLDEGNDYPLQYSCLGNPTDRGAWQATARGVTRVRHDLATKPPVGTQCCFGGWMIQYVYICLASQISDKCAFNKSLHSFL